MKKTNSSTMMMKKSQSRRLAFLLLLWHPLWLHLRNVEAEGAVVAEGAAEVEVEEVVRQSLGPA